MVFLSRTLHRSDTFAPRAIGPTSSTPRSGTSRERDAERGAEQALEEARLGRAAGVPGAAGEAGVRRRDPVGALAGRGVHAVVEVRLVPHRVGLAPRRVRQVQAVRAAGVAEHRLVGRGVAARLVGQRLEHDVQGEAAERLGLALAAVDQAAEQAGVLRRVAGEQGCLRAAACCGATAGAAVACAGAGGAVGAGRGASPWIGGATCGRGAVTRCANALRAATERGSCAVSDLAGAVGSSTPPSRVRFCMAAAAVPRVLAMIPCTSTPARGSCHGRTFALADIALDVVTRLAQSRWCIGRAIRHPIPADILAIHNVAPTPATIA